MNQPARILVIQTAFIGDAILATALLETLHHDFPEAKLDFLVRRGNESLFKHHPFLNDVLVWDKKAAGFLGKYRSLWQLLKTIRLRRYDVVLNLQRYGATGLLTAFSGANQTIGFDKNPVSWLFSHRVRHQFLPGTHEVDRNAELLGPLGSTTPNPLLKQQGAKRPGKESRRLSKAPSCFRRGLGVANRPKLYPSAADVARVGPYQLETYVCIAPTSVWFTKQFPGKQWADLINELPDNQTVYLLGAPTDQAACEAIRQQTTAPERVINLAGKLSLLESAALMTGAVMNYVNDSAPMHLASAMNAPTTAVFCSTIPDFGYGPLSDNSRVVETPVPLACRPCGIHGHRACPQGHFRCATEIKTGQLLADGLSLE
jgi:ADP-heptose:LPS heptosyltransferase